MNIRTLEVAGIAPAIIAMRNPMNSWDRIDSIPGRVGKNDKALSMRLAKAGTEHCKHLRMVVVWADITAPFYWWKQADCYKIGVEKVSCSTMHTIMKKPFEMSDFCFDGLSGYKVEPKQFIPEVNEAEEKWVDYEGYKVSNQGRIIGIHGNELSGVLHNDGYRFMWFNGRIVPMHRIVAKCFCDGYEEGKVVNHKDGNKLNNHADNLEWVTQRENIIHSVSMGLQPKSVKTYSGKLSEEERNQVKQLSQTGKYSIREIGNMFGVTHTTIMSILKGKYKYINNQVNMYTECAKPLVAELNRLREEYLESEDPEEKAMLFRSVIQLLPESYLQKRTVMMSYAALRSIYKQRKGHKLPEWQIFREWVETLPESWMITDKTEEETDE